VIDSGRYKYLPLTVAGQWRIFTAFPSIPRLLNCQSQIRRIRPNLSTHPEKQTHLAKDVGQLFKLRAGL
jgi:hypothetical protein